MLAKSVVNGCCFAALRSSVSAPNKGLLRGVKSYWYNERNAARESVDLELQVVAGGWKRACLKDGVWPRNGRRSKRGMDVRLRMGVGES